jgi:predicted RND superfamily exporter protein
VSSTPSAEELRREHRSLLLSIVKLAGLCFVVMLAAIITMAWRRELQPAISITFSLLWIAGAMGVCLYRLGAMSRD